MFHGARQSGILDHHYSESLTGNSDWRIIELRRKIPEGVYQVDFGASLEDSGAGWLDDVTLKVVPE